MKILISLYLIFISMYCFGAGLTVSSTNGIAVGLTVSGNFTNNAVPQPGAGTTNVISIIHGGAETSVPFSNFASPSITNGLATTNYVSAATNTLGTALQTQILASTNGLWTATTSAINAATNGLDSIADVNSKTNALGTSLTASISSSTNAIWSATTNYVLNSTNRLASGLLAQTAWNNFTNGATSLTLSSYQLALGYIPQFGSINLTNWSQLSTNQMASTNQLSIATNSIGAALSAQTVSATNGIWAATTNYANSVTNGFGNITTNSSANYVSSISPSSSIAVSFSSPPSGKIYTLSLPSNATNQFVLTNDSRGISLTNTQNVFVGTYTGNGSGLTNGAGYHYATTNDIAAATNGAAFLAQNQTFTGNNTFNSAITFQSSLTTTLISSGVPILFISPTSGGSVGIGYDAGVNLQNGGNVAMGSFALKTSNNGIGNTGVGYNALSLFSGTSAASYNTAIGYGSLQNGAIESEEIAIGLNSLLNDNGSNNVAIGNLSLSSTTNAVNNIAIGYQSGINYAGSESNNIDIGNSGISKENGTIHIGTPGTHTNTFIAGIINGNGSGLTNLVITGPTNTAPVNSVTPVAWANFTNSTGGTFKYPLYQ